MLKFVFLAQFSIFVLKKFLMPIYRLDDSWFGFPPPEKADKSGILAIGGDLQPERLLNAYKNGIFPWFSSEDELPIWWSPNPRFVLFPQKIKVSSSMKQVFRNKKFVVTVNKNFVAVLQGCKDSPRKGQDGTWLSEDFIKNYEILHKQGYVHSVEVWENNKLVGGLYGMILGRCFFGESMFATVSNASKVGFILLVKNLQKLGFQLIDCQVHSEHLESLGAEMIARKDFLKLLHANIAESPFDLVAFFDAEMSVF
jgi:leucyl/phenylalanyl-tRNA---protein transferase